MKNLSFSLMIKTENKLIVKVSVFDCNCKFSVSSASVKEHVDHYQVDLFKEEQYGNGISCLTSKDHL